MADEIKYTRKQFAEGVKKMNPQFANYSDDEIVDAYVARYPQYRNSIMDYSGFPTGTIGKQPTGVAGLKSKAYTYYHNLGDLIGRNLDVIGGTVGGVAGVGGGPLGAIGGATLGGGAGKAMQRLIGMAAGERPTSGDVAADIAQSGAMQGAFELGGAGISRLGKAIFPTSRSALIAFGSRAGELGPKMPMILPELDKAAAQRGISPGAMTVGDFKEVVRHAGGNLETEFGMSLYPVSHYHIDTSDIAQAAMSKITPNMAKTAEGRAIQRDLQRRAIDYVKRPWTIGQLNAEREMISKRLRAYYSAAGAVQSADLKTDARVIADKAIEEALKDKLYTVADQVGVRPPGYFQALKQKESVLMSLRDAADKAEENLTKQSFEAKGAPLSRKIHLRSYLHPHTGMPGGVAGVNLPAFFGDPLEEGNAALKKAFPGGTRQAVNHVRKVLGTSLGSRDVNALPLRLLFADTSQPGATQ